MASDILQFVVYGLLLGLIAWPLGLYMARVFTGERTLLSPVLGPSSAASTAPPASIREAEQGWLAYALSMLAFNVGRLRCCSTRSCGCKSICRSTRRACRRCRRDLAFNTAVSFVTNTNWQSYGGETTMSYFSQMAGLTVQNFVSAATGIAMARGADPRPSRARRRETSAISGSI